MSILFTPVRPVRRVVLLTLAQGVAGCFLACASVDGAGAQSQAPLDKRWTLTIDTDFRYTSWQQTEGNLPGVPLQKGSQIYVPVAAQLVGNPSDEFKIELIGRGGHVSTSRSVDPRVGAAVGYRTGTFSTPTDTVVGGTGTYLGINGFQPFVSLNANLPTGTSAVFGLAALSRTDPDLVDIASYGEGTNTGGTLGANIPFTPDVILTLSAGKTKRGAFDRDQFGSPNLLGTNTATDRINPGDNTSYTASLAMKIDALILNVSSSFTSETSSTFNDIIIVRNGKSYFVSGLAIYQWDAMWSSSLTGSWSHTERQLVSVPNGSPLLPEEQNSNSNLLRLSFEQGLAWQQFNFNGGVSYLYRDNNQYDPIAIQFVPAKTKVAVFGGVKYNATEKIVLGVRAEVFRIEENVKPDFFLAPFPAIVAGSGTPEQRFRGWQVGGSATVNF